MYISSNNIVLVRQFGAFAAGRTIQLIFLGNSVKYWVSLANLHRGCQIEIHTAKCHFEKREKKEERIFHFFKICAEKNLLTWTHGDSSAGEPKEGTMLPFISVQYTFFIESFTKIISSLLFHN